MRWAPWAPGQTDDYGNSIRFAPFITDEEREQTREGNFSVKEYGIVSRWEISTSTYGGDTVTDCNVV